VGKEGRFPGTVLVLGVLGLLLDLALAFRPVVEGEGAT